MALNREVWIDQVKEGFYPDDSFLQKVTDYSQFVDHNRLHIASAGIDPKVLVNNTTYPISVIGRDDEDNEIRLDKFETENTIVRRPEALEYSYDKLESVIGQHRSTLRASVAAKAAHAYTPAEDTENTPVITTTGESITGRKRLRFADILALKERFDDVDVPLNVWFNIEERDSPDFQELVDQYLAFEKGGGAAVDGPDAAEGALSKLNTVYRQAKGTHRVGFRPNRKY